MRGVNGVPSKYINPVDMLLRWIFCSIPSTDFRPDITCLPAVSFSVFTHRQCGYASSTLSST